MGEISMANVSKKPRVFVLTSRVYETAGGRTKATIERMMLLQKHFDATLIEMSATKYPGDELPAVFAKYKTTFNTVNPWRVGELPAHHMKNYLDYLRQRTGNLADNPRIFTGEQSVFTIPTLSGGKIKSYMDEDKITRLREYHPDGTVEFFGLDTKQNIMLRETYNGDNLTARYYLDDTGAICSGFTVGQDGDKTYLYRTHDDELIYSETIADHYTAFLNELLTDGDVVISDVRYYDAILAHLQPNVRKIHVWHEMATDPLNNDSVIPDYETITSESFTMAKADKIVVFTDDAQKAYSARFPHLKKHIAVIPYGTTIKPDIASAKRDKNLVMSIGRLEPPKNVGDQIQAFALFHATYPDTKLHIFGEGTEEESLVKLVKKLGLTDVVRFCGFTHNANKDYQRASMMLFSSQSETFGLTILESMSNGTPVASYDVRFGAKAMIDNKRNGIIAKTDTPEALAEAMIKIHTSKLTPQKVRKSIQKAFSQEYFEKQWLAITAKAK
jgi:poly(glycerol-phosphate) alpha-glucosyltransferase